MTRFVMAIPMLLVIVLLAGAASAASAQSPGCGNGIAVASPANNPGLVADCEALLAARDTLAGTGTLDWSASAPIANWDGVTLGGPQRVIGLFLREKGLTGSIPPELGNLANLRELYLYSNQLTGSIPPELGNLANLRELHLGSNQLTGSIPPELGNLANLQGLSLSNNQLTGAIPPELGNLANLKVLYLWYNQLTGWIPVELGNLANLYSLSLGSNQLTGSIPPELGNPANLYYLYLDNNQLTGSIPPELGNLANLRLNSNQLTGSIPPELGNPANLEILYLAANQLTGSIPPELGNPANLEELYLAYNQLTGCIPPGLRDVAYNDFNELGLDFCEDEEPAPADPCLEVESLGALTAPVTKTGDWADDCDSEARPGSYARYYSFTLAQAGQVEINLTSSVDSYLALRQGAGRTGALVASNDNVGSRNFNSSINRMLAAGTYTVEATTYFAGQTGDFILSVRPLQETEDLGDLTRSVDRSNSMWTSDYQSTQQGRGYARSYTFTLTAATHVVINLTSPEDPYLYVLDSNGAVVHENDNVTTRNLNSRIDQTLQRGTYTIEATTYFPARMGTFHLSIGHFGSSP